MGIFAIRFFGIRTAALSAVASVAFSLTGYAHAGLFDDEEARKRIEQLRTDVTELTTRAETVNRNQLNFANQVDAIKAELAKIRGQLEVLTYDLDSVQKRQKDFYVDLDSRVRKLEQSGVAFAKPESGKVDPAAETRDYEAALEGLKTGKFKESGAAFETFIKTWSKSSLLASAHYFGGIAFFKSKDYTKAHDLFSKFAIDWATDDRAPVALESAAESAEALKDYKSARATLEMLIEKYPSSDQAKRAKARLKKK